MTLPHPLLLARQHPTGEKNKNVYGLLIPVQSSSTLKGHTASTLSEYPGKHLVKGQRVLLLLLLTEGLREAAVWRWRVGVDLSRDLKDGISGQMAREARGREDGSVSKY